MGSDLGTDVNADISADLGAKVARRQMLRATQMFSGATVIDTSHATGRGSIGSGTVGGAKVEPVKGAIAASISVRCRTSMAALTLVRSMWPGTIWPHSPAPSVAHDLHAAIHLFPACRQTAGLTDKFRRKD
ncbi:MAG: hypothetical protein DCO97_21465 [Marivita sp. XM-24bin2]|nr:MAG: hypothetical protein DCO97_21465 [Marivita sp. XM-24bin2]